MFDELVAAIANCDVKMPNLLYLHLSAAFFISESWLGKTHRWNSNRGGHLQKAENLFFFSIVSIHKFSVI